ncbi:MAG: hypothetical protein AB7U83_23475 [Vicinamibacterales bacterium]
MFRGWLSFVAAMLAALAGARTERGPVVAAQDADPFAFLAPVATVSPSERRRLDGGDVLARTLAAGDRQAAILVLARVRAAPEHLVAWTHAIERFKRGRFVVAIGRFSEPPVLEDLAGLSLDTEDVAALLRCRAGDCGLKLTAAEMRRFAAVRATPAAAAADAVQATFRHAVLDRVQTYRGAGLAGLDPIADREPRRTVEAFTALLERSPYLAGVAPLRDWLHRYPLAATPGDTFFYWSKESYGSGKPVVAVTHVAIHRPPDGADAPAVVVAGKQLLATHYTVASLGLTMFLGGRDGGPAYLAYLNRTELDILGGLFGRMARAMMERRLSRQTPVVVDELRRRLESGMPSPATP